MSNICSVPYRAPDGHTHYVDRGLDHRILDRLNRLPGLRLHSICAGHDSAWPRAAHVMFVARRLHDVLPYLDAGVYLEGFGSQSVYPARNEGGPTRWTYAIKADSDRRPPSRHWWKDLIETLEEAAPPHGVSEGAPSAPPTRGSVRVLAHSRSAPVRRRRSVRA